MTLHEAIEKVLNKKGRQMTTTEIANELNVNKWYQKRDGSEILPFQIHGRTRNYPGIFDRDGSTVSLIGKSNSKVSTSRKSLKKSTPKLSEISTDITLLEKVLMNEKNFKDASSVDNLVPNVPGLYCIRIKNINNLPATFKNALSSRKHNIIYIGIASKNLMKRFLNQELRANGHGTFFRSLGAVLGYKPEKGSLLSKANKRNYKFKPEHEIEIISWINKKLKVNWVVFQGDFENLETSIIQRHLPLLNIAKNPLALRELSELRAECVKVANN